jgi:hypothetical protein
VGLVHVQIESLAEAGGDIVVVKLTGHADPASVHALISELQILGHAHREGMLRILVDESELQPGLVGFDDIADMVHDWRTSPALRSSRIAIIAANPFIRGLNQMFRVLANLERKDSLNAFTKRADAVAWLVSKATASP